MDKLKSAIIGKMWANVGHDIVPATYALPTDMIFNANESYLIGGLSFRTDRNLIEPVEVKAGARLFFYTNKKRADKQDPDYSVSVLLPEAQADEVIANSRAGAEKWRNAQQVA